MKIARRILVCIMALSLVLVVLGLAGGGSAGESGGSGGGVPATPYKPTDKITSDGETYTLKKIDGVKLEAVVRETLPAVGSKETLLKLLKERGALYDSAGWDNSIRFSSYGGDDMVLKDGAVAASPGSADMSGPMAEEPQMMEFDSAESGAGGHSETNEQVAGVNEGDIVKTDGKYIYAMSGNTLRIIRAGGADMKVVSTIQIDNIWGTEFYVIGDKLAVVGQAYLPFDLFRPAEEPPSVGSDEKILADSDMPSNYWVPQRDFTVLVVYDVTDRENPFEARRVELEGYGVATRVIGETVYLVTNKYVWGIPYDQADSGSILPYCRDTAEGEDYEPVPYDSMYYIPGTTDASYLLVGAVNINDDGAALNPQAYLGAGNQLYMSRNAIYLTQTRWAETGSDGFAAWAGGGQVTDILRFEIDGTDIRYGGKGTVAGSPLNQYSMDEHNGYFRIATTQWGIGTAVTVLDGDMNTVGQTPALMPDERMQSMRFMGDMGYIVTFQNTDPLFTIDLSDPYNPKVLGELKIPGFSQYLHPVGDGLLLGIGRDTQELYTRDKNGVETVVGFRDVGMKVSLFDVSNPYDPREVDTLSLGEGWAEVSYNPRALMCDPSRGLFGFTMESWNSIGYNFSATIFRVEGHRLTVANTLDTGEKFTPWGSRLLFIGDTLYLAHDQGMMAYDYYTFAKTGNLTY